MNILCGKDRADDRDTANAASAELKHVLLADAADRNDWNINGGANITKGFFRQNIYICFGRSREQINDIINAYNSASDFDKAFKVSSLMNIINTKNMNITGEEMRTYNIMLNYLYQTTRISVSEERNDYLRKNALAQTGLWKFGVSGDRPIISVEISDISDMGFVLDVLKAFENTEYAARLKATGVIISYICPLMYMNNPLCKTMPVITSSNKLRTYTSARYYRDEEILAMITKGGK